MARVDTNSGDPVTSPGRRRIAHPGLPAADAPALAGRRRPSAWPEDVGPARRRLDGCRPSPGVLGAARVRTPRRVLTRGSGEVSIPVERLTGAQVSPDVQGRPTWLMSPTASSRSRTKSPPYGTWRSPSAPVALVVAARVSARAARTVRGAVRRPHEPRGLGGHVLVSAPLPCRRGPGVVTSAALPTGRGVQARAATPPASHVQSARWRSRVSPEGLGPVKTRPASRGLCGRWSATDVRASVTSMLRSATAEPLSATTRAR